jgi:hypothetical protein
MQGRKRTPNPYDPFDDFDTKFDKAYRRSFRVGLAIWLVTFAVSSALMVGVIWVAWHFISKFW